MAATQRRYHGIHAWSHLLPDTKGTSSQQESSAFTSGLETVPHSLFLLWKRMFSDQICFQNKGIHLPKPARERGGQHSFLCSREVKVTQLLGGVKKPRYLPDASIERCQMPSPHVRGWWGSRAPHIQAHAESLFCLLWTRNTSDH